MEKCRRQVEEEEREVARPEGTWSLPNAEDTSRATTRERIQDGRSRAGNGAGGAGDTPLRGKEDGIGQARYSLGMPTAADGTSKQGKTKRRRTTTNDGDGVTTASGDLTIN